MIHVDVLLIVFSPLMDHPKSSIWPSTKYGFYAPWKGVSDLNVCSHKHLTTSNSLPFVEVSSAWGNISFLGAMHHGKTTFMDLLVLNTHEKDWKVGKEIRLLPGKVVGFWGVGRKEKEKRWVGSEKGEPNMSYCKRERGQERTWFCWVWMDLILIDFHVMSMFMLDVTAGYRITVIEVFIVFQGFPPLTDWYRRWNTQISWRYMESERVPNESFWVNMFVRSWKHKLCKPTMWPKGNSDGLHVWCKYFA